MEWNLGEHSVVPLIPTDTDTVCLLSLKLLHFLNIDSFKQQKACNLSPKLKHDPKGAESSLDSCNSFE